MPHDRSARRADLIILGLLMLLVTSLYFDILFLGNNLFARDLTVYHYPMKKEVRDTVLGGDFPLWNWRYAAGQPMAANPAYEVFYPPQWLTLIPDYNLGFRLHILLHVYLAAIGAFLFLRSRGVRHAVAFLGGAAFVMCGPFVSVVNLLPFMFSAAWVPWIALFAGRYFDARRVRDLVALILFIGMQALICEPTTLLQTWFVMGLWASWVGWHRVEVRRGWSALRGFASAVMIAVAGVMVAAVQFLPGLDHASDSVRRYGFPWEVVSQWSFPPLRYVELIFPNFLGIVENGGPRFWGRSLYPTTGGPFLYSVYVGLAFAALGIAGLVIRRRGSGLVLVALASSVIIALGSWSPVLRVFYDANLLPSIRYPEKFVLMTGFILLAWGCFVLDDVAGGDRRAARVTLGVVACSLLIAVAMLVWTYMPGYASGFTAFWPKSDPGSSDIARVLWAVAIGRALAFLFAIELVRRSGSRTSMVLLVLVVVADLAPLGNQVNPRMPRRFFDPPPQAKTVGREANGARLIYTAWLDPGEQGFGEVGGGYESYWRLRNALVPRLPSAWGISTVLEWDVDETHLTHTRDFQMFARAASKDGLGPEAKWRMHVVRQVAQMCNGGVLAWASQATAPGTERPQDPELSSPVEFQAVDILPRYYFATEVVLVEDVRRMFENLVGHNWPRKVAFVYEPGVSAAAGMIQSVEEHASSVDLDVETLGDATLVASVTRHKYWSATLDGGSIPIIAVNHAFQGVRVPLGRHHVRLSYWNPIIPAGIAVSLTMIAGLMFTLVRSRAA